MGIVFPHLCIVLREMLRVRLGEELDAGDVANLIQPSAATEVLLCRFHVLKA